MTDVAGTALVDGDGGFQDGFFKLCYQKEQTEPRAQPWKAHWSGEQQAVDGAQHFHYPSDKDGAALVDGFSDPGHGGGYFSDLCCQKERAKPRAQPWKVYWSGEQQAVRGDQHSQYLSDKDGAALVDGAGSGPGLGDGDGYFFDLCC